ncbi:MAG: helix-turn-helix transcriptional regulator [Treponema sp.]|nr:helix-turn-helix transcriptional regulator [Treponema sp.]
MAGISTNILAKLNKGEYISMDSPHKICTVMNCDIGDIATFRK